MLASGLLDAYIAMIPKADGDSTSLGQRPLSVLPVVYRLWASLRLGHLREWVLGWVPQSVYSLGNGLSSVEAWYSTALDVEEVLAGIGSDQLHVWSLMSSSLLTRLIGPSLTVPWVDFGFLPGFVRCISHFILKSG